ncbi:MAG: peptidase M28 [Thermoflexus sp.]|uniref:M42 family metallopeptidase n=1 Tax=Thermoflexus sp. TaxID=1969742 RepID=UPI0033174EEC
MDALAELLRILTEAHGVPGYESEVREVMRGLLQDLGEVEQDNIGSLICRRGEGGPRVMLAAHMDEIGFMVKHVTPEGFIRFTPLGGWFDQVLLGQRVVIKTHKGDVVGVIGAKPPHLLPPDERKKVIEKKDMYIDIGATSAKEVEEAGVRVGDPIVPLAPFQVLANGKTYLAKAFDDRVGCAVLVEVMRRLAREGHPNVVYGVATVQEEVGLRGAATSVEKVNPDVALILESDIAGDVPGIKPEESAVKLGGGPTIVVYDARMIPNLRLRDLAIEVARSLQIPVQFSVLEGGATDGGIVHLHKGGVPTLVIGVPARHIHSHGAIVHRDDVERAIALVTALVRRLDAETVARLRP